MVKGNKAPENIKLKEAVQPLINTLKDEDKQVGDGKLLIFH
jgi:hypothetical protein